MNNKPCTNTVEIFKKITGIDDIDFCLMFCLPAIEFIETRLKDKTLAVDSIYDLYFAAAYLAYYRCFITGGLEKFAEMRAGNVTYKMPKHSIEILEKNLNFALISAKPYLVNSAVFKTVGGLNG